MPLQNSSSNAARSANIAAEVNAGKPQKQAVAIGYAVQRRAKGLPSMHEHADHLHPAHKR